MRRAKIENSVGISPIDLTNCRKMRSPTNMAWDSCQEAFRSGVSVACNLNGDGDVYVSTFADA